MSKSEKDSLGDRMKKYESISSFSLPERMPIIIRVDGCHFHTYTKSCDKPIDGNLVLVMNDTAKYLCNNIQNAKFAYVQSDEISILLYPSDIKSQYWYDNNLNKIVSVSAALASACFTNLSGKIFNGVAKIATFDSRAFVLPLFEVENYFIWRQSDALRNSVSTLARSLFSHKQCLNKNSDELKKMCKDVLPWENMSNSFKRGRVILKTESSKESLNPKTKEKIVAIRKEWSVDNEIPIFSEYKEYIRDFLK